VLVVPAAVARDDDSVGLANTAFSVGLANAACWAAHQVVSALSITSSGKN